MLRPSLQLERSFFTEVEIAADHQHKPGEGKAEVAAAQSIKQASDDGAHWVVELDLTVAGKEGTPGPPYRVHLHTVGAFSFAAGTLSELEKARLLAVTGVSILYSQAREYLLILTARGPWGPFQLPTVSFIDNEPHASAPPSPVIREHASVPAPQQRPTRGHREPPQARRRKAQVR
jgi:preprotein translocase subunit SecB